MKPDLAPGALLDGRFAIEAPVGEGGMGVVYRAYDLLRQGPAAVKLLHGDPGAPLAQEHFQREAEILGALRHPHIVSYLAHGCAPCGAPYLAMDWLDGEDLGQRLRRGPLRLREVLRLGAAIADALHATHAHGVVHRDLKPANLFLRGGEIAQVVLLDFGVARHLSAARQLTRTGTILGTPAYMAPEQVRGERVGPAADVFSLGCVLYECLAGRPPFSAEQMISVLAQILFEEAADVRALRPGVPAAVAELMARMLAKDPRARISDGEALCHEWSRLPRSDPEDEDEGEGEDAGAPPGDGLRGDLQELLCVVMAGAAGPPPHGEDEQGGAAGALLAGLRGLRGHADLLPDGSLVSVFQGFQSATDQAVQAAHAALLLREAWPGARVVVTTGRGARPGEVPMGEALDRAARMLSQQTLPGEGTGGQAGLLLDEVTTALVEGRFEVARRGTGVFELRGPRTTPDESRPLLGRPTPCVGRERELAQLDGLFAQAVDEPLAAAVLVTGPPGSG